MPPLAGQGDARRGRGSGYLVAAGWVLTAAHVVRDATGIAVWLGAPRTLDPALAVPVDPGRKKLIEGLDLALLPVPEAGAPDGFVAPPFGVLDRDSAVPVPVAAVGFPWFALHPDPDRRGVEVRETHTAVGMVAGLSGARLGAVEWAVRDRPAAHPDPQRSCWEGMSGAAVFTAPGGELAGVVGQHAPGLRPGMLTVRPLAVEPGEGGAPLSARDRWTGLLPQLQDAVPVVTPPSTRDLADRRAHAAARSVTPTVLVGRDSELADLAAFANDEGQQWRWIRAEAFAGKTALLGWFTLHPPPGIDVVACFLRQTTVENTAAYALGRLTAQLAGLLDRKDYRAPEDVGDRISDLRDDLLPAAAQRLSQQGRRLLLVIDGLDEYDPLDGRDLAMWLPDAGSLPPSAALIAASRAGVPVRLADGHRTASAVTRIAPSDVAAEVRRQAQRELEHAKTLRPGDPALRYWIGACLAACGGRISRVDLATWLSRRGDPVLPGELADRLEHWYRRTIHSERAGDSDILAFSHQALLTEATDTTFADDLPALRDQLHVWARECGRAGWPPDTPTYFLTGYRRILRDEVGDRDPAPPDALDRIVEVLDDSQYRKSVRRVRGWLVDYVEDVEFLARRAPDRARAVCRRAFVKGYPNSYLRRRLADVLVSTVPPLLGPPPERRPLLTEVAAYLRSQPADADWLIRAFRSHYKETSSSPVATLLILGVGHVGGSQAAKFLLDIFQSPHDQLAWVAADALLVASQPRRGVPDTNVNQVRADVIRALVAGYPGSRSHADRRRRLYVLGFLNASQARDLAVAACDSTDPKTLGWAIRLLAATGATPDQVDRWLGWLDEIVNGRAAPVWRNEWAQKRLIRALDASILSPSQSMRAVALVNTLRELIADAPAPASDSARAARRALNEAMAQFGIDGGPA